MRLMKKRLGRKGVLVLIGILVGGSVILGFLFDTGAGGMPAGTGWLAAIGGRVPTIGIIYVDGIIAGGTSSSGLFGVTTGSDEVVTYLKEATEDGSVRAVVLRVNSPGGSAPAAQEISREIQKFREAGKTLVVSMGDMAASGAYYISAGADMIMANPGTITGSIGAIMSITNVEELYRKIGVREEAIKSGPHKDIGSGTRPMTEEERRILEELVNAVYRQFLEAVATGRGMSVDELKPIADGRILTGSQAREAGLVDEIGNFQDAIDAAANLAGIEGRYRVKEYGVLSPLEILLRRLGLSASGGGALNRLLSYPGLPRGLGSAGVGIGDGQSASFGAFRAGGDDGSGSGKSLAPVNPTSLPGSLVKTEEDLWALYYAARTMLVLP